MSNLELASSFSPLWFSSFLKAFPSHPLCHSLAGAVDSKRPVCLRSHLTQDRCLSETEHCGDREELDLSDMQRSWEHSTILRDTEVKHAPLKHQSSWTNIHLGSKEAFPPVVYLKFKQRWSMISFLSCKPWAHFHIHRKLLCNYWLIIINTTGFSR